MDTPLLKISNIKMLSFLNEGFEIPPENVPDLFKEETSLLEKEALNYFGGYVLSRLLKEFHDGDCDSCSALGQIIDSSTTVLHNGDLFVFLKRYQDDVSSLYTCNESFLEFVSKTCCVVSYCWKHYFSSSLFLKSINESVKKHVVAPVFCTVAVRDKVISLVVRTYFHYKLKWLNDDIRNSVHKSGKKFKRVTHQSV